MPDVDHFKPINDRYVHLTGDERAAPRGLSQVSRLFPVMPAGLDGEEYDVALPGLDPAAAWTGAGEDLDLLRLPRPDAGA